MATRPGGTAGLPTGIVFGTPPSPADPMDRVSVVPCVHPS